jgi:hypothetical protein
MGKHYAQEHCAVCLAVFVAPGEQHRCCGAVKESLKRSKCQGPFRVTPSQPTHHTLHTTQCTVHSTRTGALCPLAQRRPRHHARPNPVEPESLNLRDRQPRPGSLALSSPTHASRRPHRCLFAVATGLVCSSGLCTWLTFTRRMVDASSLTLQDRDWAAHGFSLTLNRPCSLAVIHRSRMLDACCGSGALARPRAGRLLSSALCPMLSVCYISRPLLLSST